MSGASKCLFEKAKTLKSKARFAGFAGRNLALQIRFKFGKCPVEFVASPDHLASFPDALDGFLENVEGYGHAWISRPAPAFFQTC
jgi:hypothetical protein